MESRADVEIGNEEEESSESEVPTVETNLKNLMRKAQQEREDCGHAVYRNWCAVCVRGRCVEKHLQVELLKEEETERTRPSLAAFNHVSVSQENADKFPILIGRSDEQSQTRVTWCGRKSFIPHLISFLVDFVENLDFGRITLKCENEPSMKVFRESMSHLMVRETKRQYRSLRTSEECSTNVKITDEISKLNWIPHFPVKLLNKRRIDRRWRKPKGTIWNVNLVPNDWRRRYQLNSETKNSRNLCR